MKENQKINIQTQISNSLIQAIKKSFNETIDPIVEIPTELSKGDFSSNVAMRNSKKFMKLMRLLKSKGE